MTYFHAKDIAHRDLKLENILYIQEGVIKVIDFGFAVQSKEKQRTFCGTPTYMAPEIVKRVPYKGSEVDVWAVGIMVYRMLTGTYPFMARTDKELYKKIISGNFEVTALQDEKSRDLVSRMLRVNPSERPTAAEVSLAHKDCLPSMDSFSGLSQRRSCIIISLRSAKNSFIILNMLSIGEKKVVRARMALHESVKPKVFSSHLYKIRSSN